MLGPHVRHAGSRSCNASPSGCNRSHVAGAVRWQLDLVSICRFVGMLLAANTLPKEDWQKLQQVHEAAGSAFFDRLLLPLKSQQVCQLHHTSKAFCTTDAQVSNRKQFLFLTAPRLSSLTRLTPLPRFSPVMLPKTCSQLRRLLLHNILLQCLLTSIENLFPISYRQ